MLVTLALTRVAQRRLDIDYAPTGRELVTGSYDRTIRIFPVDQGHSREVYHTQRMQRYFSLPLLLHYRWQPASASMPDCWLGVASTRSCIAWTTTTSCLAATTPTSVSGRPTHRSPSAWYATNQSTHHSIERWLDLESGRPLTPCVGTAASSAQAQAVAVQR